MTLDWCMQVTGKFAVAVYDILYQNQTQKCIEIDLTND